MCKSQESDAYHQAGHCVMACFLLQQEKPDHQSLFNAVFLERKGDRLTFVSPRLKKGEDLDTIAGAGVAAEWWFNNRNGSLATSLCKKDLRAELEHHAPDGFYRSLDGNKRLQEDILSAVRDRLMRMTKQHWNAIRFVAKHLMAAPEHVIDCGRVETILRENPPAPLDKTLGDMVM